MEILKVELLKETQQTMLMELTPATRKHTAETFNCDLPTNEEQDRRSKGRAAMIQDPVTTDEEKGCHAIWA